MDHIVTPPSNSNHSRDGTGQGLRKKTNNTQNKKHLPKPGIQTAPARLLRRAQAQYRNSCSHETIVL
jgi:hypothetical protein